MVSSGSCGVSARLCCGVLKIVVKLDDFCDFVLLGGVVCVVFFSCLKLM